MPRVKRGVIARKAHKKVLKAAKGFRGRRNNVFRIANEAHVDIRQHNPSLPACVAAIANKTLAKQPEQRYQSCDQMAKALRLCLSSLKGMPKPASETAR